MHDDFDANDSAEAEVTPAPQPTLDPGVGIDIRQRQRGETILIEAEDGIYEFMVVDPDMQYVQITGSDRRLHRPTIGLLAYSYSALDPNDRRNAWIGPARRLHLVFANASHETGVILSASVRGNNWHLDVF